MQYVFVLQSTSHPGRFYTGITSNIERRIEEHNGGKSIHTNKFKPGIVRTYIAFNDRVRAERLETYLKSSSGRAFMTKRF